MPGLFLIRHGQASFGAQDYDQLSELGWQQARWLGEYLSSQYPQSQDKGLRQAPLLMCGTLKRQQQTAEGIAEALSKDLSEDQKPTTANIIHIPQLNEFDFADVLRAYQLTGPQHAQLSSRADFFRLLKAAVYAWQRGELDSQVQQSWVQFQQQVGDAMAEVEQQHASLVAHQRISPEAEILIVSSGGVIASMVGQMLNADAASIMDLNLQIKNTSLSRCAFRQSQRHSQSPDVNDGALGKWQLCSFNSTAHLDHKPDGSITFS